MWADDETYQKHHREKLEKAAAKAKADNEAFETAINQVMANHKQEREERATSINWVYTSFYCMTV